MLATAKGGRRLQSRAMNNPIPNPEEGWITLAEAERLHGWSRSWWAQRIKGKSLTGRLDDSGSVPVWFVRKADAEKLAKEKPFAEKGSGKARKFPLSSERLKAGVKSWRQSVESEGGERMEVVLGKEASDQLTVLRKEYGDASRKASKRQVIEALILGTKKKAETP